MATKPSNLAEWATGSAPIVEPTTPQKQAGWPVAFKPPAQWFNWWMKLIHQWIIWLDAFESDPHTWTSLQTFNGRAVMGSSGGSPTLTVNKTGSGRAMNVLSDDQSIYAEAPFGSIWAVAPLGGTTGWGVRGQTSEPLAPALWGFIDVANGTGLSLEGGTYAGITLLRGSATGVNSVGIDIQADLWGVQGTARAATGTGVRGTGQANGVSGTGTTGSNGIGVRGTGAGTGLGGRFQGGSNAPGVLAQAGGGNQMGTQTVGSGTGPGVEGIGGSNGVGGRFIAGSGVTTDPAIDSAGPIMFNSAGDPATSANVAQRFHRKQANRCWALIQLNGTASPAILDAVGISGVVQQTTGNGVIDVTMAQPMANTSYGIFPSVSASLSNARVARAVPTSTTVFRVEVYDPSAPSTVLTAGASSGMILLVVVLGTQP